MSGQGDVKMGTWRKNKGSKESVFAYDENNDCYKAEIDGIEFTCDRIHSDYEHRAVELAQHMKRDFQISQNILCQILRKCSAFQIQLL